MMNRKMGNDELRLHRVINCYVNWKGSGGHCQMLEKSTTTMSRIFLPFNDWLTIFIVMSSTVGACRAWVKVVSHNLSAVFIDPSIKKKIAGLPSVGSYALLWASNTYIKIFLFLFFPLKAITPLIFISIISSTSTVHVVHLNPSLAKSKTRFARRQLFSLLC